jgi:hypothetical protein
MDDSETAISRLPPQSAVLSRSRDIFLGRSLFIHKPSAESSFGGDFFSAPTPSLAPGELPLPAA